MWRVERKYVMLLSSTLIDVRQSHGSPFIITVTHATWNPHTSTFSIPRHWQIPLPGELELLAASVVANGQSGQSEPHLAIRRNGDMVIGVLDLAKESFHSLVQLALPVDDGPNSNKPTSSSPVTQCRITDGPVVVALCENDLLVAWFESTYWDATESAEQTVDFWNAYLFHLKDFGDMSQIRIIYCGDSKNFAGPELILSIQNISAGASERSNNEWAYVSLPLHTFPFSERHPAHPADSTSKLCWLTVPCSYVFQYCKGTFPPEIDPNLIACAEFVPANSSTISLSIWSHENRDLTNGPKEVIIALYDGRVLKVKHGRVAAIVNLEDAPMSIQFAVVAEGQGILVTKFSGSLNKVVVLCAETLEQLQVWSRVQEAVVGDLQVLGHDQIILLLNPKPETHDVTRNDSKKYFQSVQITDLKSGLYTGAKHCQVLNSSGVAIDNHRVHSLNSFAQLLESRLEAGLAEMDQLKTKRESKIELLHSSCELMQSMVTQHEVPPAASKEIFGLLQKSEPLLLSRKSKYVQDVAIEQGTCGRTWLVMIDFQSIIPRGSILQNVSLLLTSIQGQIDARCSNVDSLCAGGGKKCLVAAVPLKSVPTLSCLPHINVIMSAEVLMDDQSTGFSAETTICDVQKGKRICWHHTEWVGQIQVDSMNSLRPYDPEMVPIIFREVAPKEMFVMRARAENQMNFVNLFRTVVQMKFRQQHLHKSNDVAGRVELVASNCALWADATIVSLGNVHAVTLRAEDLHHLSVVKACLFANLENQFDLLPIFAYPEGLADYRQLAELFQKELMFQDAFLSVKESKSQEHKGLTGESSERPEELQMITDRYCGLISSKCIPWR